jgi:hypothetical protein
MLKPTLQRMLATAKQLWRQPRALAWYAALYALLLATLYGFAVVREATLGQVLLTVFLMLAASLEFLMLQAAIVDNAQNRPIKWRRIMRSSLRLAAVTFPVVVVAAALFVLLMRWEAGFPAPAASRQLHWPTLLFSTLRWLVFGIALPLATIYLWLLKAEISNLKSQDPTDVRRSTPSIMRRGKQVLANAFTPGSVLTYTIGLVLFALVPYGILFVQLPLQGGRTDFVILIARLVFVFIATLFGWVLTITALAQDAVEVDAEIMDDEESVGTLELQAHGR